MILGGMLEPGDVKEEWRFEAVSPRGFCFRCIAITGREPLMIQPIVNNGDALASQPKEGGNVARGVFADGHDPVLAPGEPPDEYFGVDHALPVVFFGDMKGREIVDGGNQRTRFGPEHAAIARDVEDI